MTYCTDVEIVSPARGISSSLTRERDFITGAIEISRLRRIALRVVMVKQAVDGADFIEVFRGFLDATQSGVESYRSVVRVFRSRAVRGTVCFTKGSAYATRTSTTTAP